jgi:hypothetical protein
MSVSGAKSMCSKVIRASRKPRHVFRAGVWLLLAAVAVAFSGCGMLAQQTEAPRPSGSIQSFMQQPRPGNGIIGP